MLVYVATKQQFDSAFRQWINESPSNKRKIVYTVFCEFMMTSYASAFNTCTHLISFPVDKWNHQFELWVSSEIVRVPESKNNIEQYSKMTKKQINDVDWAMRYKLIAKECLDQK